jgi:N-acyl-D-amino-acid deacylase
VNDLVLKNAIIIDGSGTSGYPGHIAISGRRISEISIDGRVPSGTEVLDVYGLSVSPGFIDMHSHSDLAVVQGGDHSAKLAQGVTTELCGQDGLSIAPRPARNDSAMPPLVEALYGSLDAAPGKWESVGDYLDLIDSDAPNNVAALIGLGTIRAAVMGFDDREPTKSETQQMRAAVRAGMEQGALGVSTGLTYAPGSYASTAELIELCREVAALGGFHDTHQRSYGVGAYEGYEEMVEISLASGCALHLAHAEIDFPLNAGRDRDLLRLIDEAERRGVDISFDILPYELANTSLAAMLPGWAHAGGPAETLRLLGESESRERLRHTLEVTGSDGAFGIPMGWELYEIGSRPASTEWVGWTVRAAADELGIAPSEFFFDTLVEDQLGTMTLIHMGHEAHIRNMMQHSAFMASSDAILTGEKPHPRGWGAFPRFLGHYARDLGILRMEECVAHMTSRPAARLRLIDRGLITPGYFADLVVFDAATILDTATYGEPKRAPIGIPHVLVNGALSIRDGVATGARAGGAIRRGRDTYAGSSA